MNNVKVHVYQRKQVSSGNRPGLIFIHGGGYVFGSIGMLCSTVKCNIKLV